MTNVFPAADQVATAIVAACRLTGDDPIACATGETGLHARPMALEALQLRFPQARKVGLARCVGYQPLSGSGSLSMARKTSWWSDDLIDEVVGALIPEEEEHDL